MRILRFCPLYSDEWTEVHANGPDAEDALSILAARLDSRGDDVEIIDREDDDASST